MIQEYRQQRPEDHITLIVESRAEECAKFIDRAPWDDLWVIPKGHKYVGAWKILLKLRKGSFDLIISAKPKPMKLNSLLLGLSGAKNKKAVCHFPKKWYEWGINQPIALEKVSSFDHQAMQTMSLIVDKPRLDPIFWPRFKGGEKASVSDSLGSLKIYINLTNNRDRSRLSLEQVIETLKLLKRSVHLVLAAMKSDSQTLDTWYNALDNSLAFLPDSSVEKRLAEKFEETCQSLFSSDIVLTGDGGLMHMAASAQRPLVALFGQTCVKRWRPLSSNAQILFHPERVDQIDPLLIKKAIEVFLGGNQDVCTSSRC